MGTKKHVAATRKSRSKSRKPTRGLELFNYLVQLTDLPAHKIKEDLMGILKKKNVDLKHLTLDDLRAVASMYVRQIMCGILEKVPKQETDLH